MQINGDFGDHMNSQWCEELVPIWQEPINGLESCVSPISKHSDYLYTT